MSSESPRASADLNTQVADRTPAHEPGRQNGSPGPDGGPGGPGGAAGTDFGPNQWLVDELYQRYQADPSSVDRAWWNFFADYQPQPGDPAATTAAAAGTAAPPAPAAPAAPVPPPAPAQRPAGAPR
ncbi:MAG TPA: hypothetical protein VFV41_19615, partial [Streptosporangiaceae bacterium]|nr:hypothetical protein [Streptosporangiaceae bacterium]